MEIQLSEPTLSEITETYEAPEIDIVETEYDLASYYETAGGLPPAAAAVAAIAAAVYSRNCAW